MVSNQHEREMQMLMFNDPIMMMYMIVSIYLLLKNKPVLASCFVHLLYQLKLV